MFEEKPKFAEMFSRIVSAMVRKTPDPGRQYHERLFTPTDKPPAGEPLKQIRIDDLDPITLKLKPAGVFSGVKTPPAENTLVKSAKKKSRRDLKRELAEIREKIRHLENLRK